MSPRAVAVVHRQAMVAEGMAAALARQPDIALVGVATTAAEAESYAGRADAFAIDETLPGAVSLAARLRAAGAWVVLLGEGDGAPADRARVSTRSSIRALAFALVSGSTNGKRVSGPRPLSPREREILGLVARGAPGKQVARRLGISPKTVEQHKARIFAKLGVPNQTAAVHSLLTQGDL